MDHKWSVSYSRIDAIVDKTAKFVDLIEESPTQGGSAWIVYHLKRTSPLIIDARREGTQNRFRLRVGEKPVNLQPSISPFGIESVSIEDKIVEIGYCGLGGSSVGIAAREKAKGVISAEMIGEPGGSSLVRAKLVLPRKERVVVGVDDTDNQNKGATWSLTHNIASMIEKEGIGSYLYHSIVQLYSKNPYKTQNCASTAVEFATNDVDGLIKKFELMLEKNTLSENTGMAVLNDFELKKEIRDYGKLVKRRLVNLNSVYDISEKCNIKLYPITGERGLIGSAAAIAFYNDPDEGVEL
jgi:methanogenesis imperfect marker protein 11